MMKNRVAPVIIVALIVVVGCLLITDFENADPEPQDAQSASIAQDEASTPRQSDSRDRPSRIPYQMMEHEEVEDSPGDLVGMVVNWEGTPVRNARVELREETSDVRRILYTDSEGDFIWPQAPEGDWRVIASYAGHNPTASTPLRHDQPIMLELNLGGTVTGQIVAPDQSPIHQFEIEVATVDLEFADPGMARRREMPQEEFVDEAGEFEFGPLENGTYRLLVSADGYAPTKSEAFDITGDDQVGPITVEMSAGATLRGTVRDEQSGRPIADARIIYTVQRTQGQPPTTHTDSSGRFELTGVPPGRSSMRVFHDDYRSELVGGIEVDDRGEARRDVDLTALGDGPPGQYVHGVGLVLGPAPRQGFKVTVVHDDTPAHRAGIERGDIVYQVDGTDVTDRTTADVTELIRGIPNTPITVDIYRSGIGHRSIDLQRQRIFRPRPEQAHAVHPSPPNQD